jgi:hypothetical protein
MPYARSLNFVGTVQHTLVRADGSRQVFAPDARALAKPVEWYREVWGRLRKCIPFFAAMSFAAFLHWIMGKPQYGAQFAIITIPGIDYLAAAFASNTNPIANFNHHSYGTGDVHGATNPIASATNTTPIVVTRNGHSFNNADIVKVGGETVMTAINGIWQVGAVTANTYTLLGSAGNGVLGGSPVDQLLNGQADTALTAEVVGISRGTGTQSNPSPNTYKTTATVSFLGAPTPQTIVEWGLFSAASGGTLWDRRWMNTANAPNITATAALAAAPITITSQGDSINTTYTLTCNAGGS